MFDEKNITRGISVSANAGKTDSDYRSVTEQAGIYAGKEGFDITVEGNTDLKGAVIASEADADKNTLTTGTISFSDIQNKAEYDTKGIGMTLDASKTSGNQPATVGQKGLIPNVPAKVSDSAESTTKSGVSEGKINITKPEKQKQDVSTLNRDTKNTLNKLDKIFDLEKIREDQETAALFGELAANGIHVLAEKNKWKEGSPEKIALHAAVGAVVAKLTNGSVMSGAVTGGATEYLTKLILEACKGDKAKAQWVAMIVGAAISGATGDNLQMGAFIAVNAIRNNDEFDEDNVVEAIENAKWGENFSVIRGEEITPENVALLNAMIVDKLTDRPKADAIMFYAEAGLGKGAGAGGGVIFYFNQNNVEVYYTGDLSLSKGFSTSRFSGEICLLEVVSLTDEVLTSQDKRDVILGYGAGVTGYYGLGGGVSTPVEGDHVGKAAVVKAGVGTPQAGLGGGITSRVKETFNSAVEFAEKMVEYQEGHVAEMVKEVQSEDYIP